MPGHTQLSSNYLVEVYQEHMSFLKSLMEDKKFCFIIDESPEVLGHPAVNTLVSFYNDSIGKVVHLIDTCIVKASNSTTLTFILDCVLREIGKKWDDVEACIIIVDTLVSTIGLPPTSKWLPRLFSPHFTP